MKKLIYIIKIYKNKIKNLNLQKKKCNRSIGMKEDGFDGIKRTERILRMMISNPKLMRQHKNQIVKMTGNITEATTWANK